MPCNRMTIQGTEVSSEERELLPGGLQLKNLPAIRVMEMAEEVTAETVEAGIKRSCVCSLRSEVVAIS